MAEHSELETLFNTHQRALLAKDVDGALGSIMRFGNMLVRHILYEEKTVLPLYAAKAGETPGGTLQIFHAEHRKLRESAARLRRRTAALKGSSDMLGSIIGLLDEEAMFKGLFQHHSLREQNLLFPRLDASTTEDERKKALTLRSRTVAA